MKQQKDIRETIVWKCYIYVHGSAPQQARRYLEELVAIFGSGNVAIRHNSDIGSFLRK